MFGRANVERWFQFTLPRGERHPNRRARQDPTTVSIHAPARGATFSLRPDTLYLSVFQFTLPRGERLQDEQDSHTRQWVSIHAPARGATTLATLW